MKAKRCYMYGAMSGYGTSATLRGSEVKAAFNREADIGASIARVGGFTWVTTYKWPSGY
jgi:hypothetical protein